MNELIQKIKSDISGKLETLYSDYEAATAEQERLAAIAEQQRVAEQERLAAIAEQQRVAEQERLAAIAEQQRVAE